MRRRSEPVKTYQLISPEASEILNNNKRVLMSELVSNGLANLVAVGYETYVGTNDISMAMRKYGRPYVYASWVRNDAVRFIIQDQSTNERTYCEYLSVQDIFRYYSESNKDRYYIFVTDVEYEVPVKKRGRKPSKPSEDKISMHERKEILAKLNKLRGEVDMLIAEVSGEDTVKEEPVVVSIIESEPQRPQLVVTRHRAFNASYYLKPNGRANLKFISDALVDYLSEQTEPVSLRELYLFCIKYFPKIGDKHSIEKAVDNAIQLHMKHNDRVTKLGRGYFTAK
jgi:hypothetical protein